MDEKPRVLAVLSGKQAFAMYSRECQEAMIAKNPPGTDPPPTVPFVPRRSEARFPADEWEPEFIELHQQVQDQAGEIAALKEEQERIIFDIGWLYAAVLALQAAGEARG